MVTKSSALKAANGDRRVSSNIDHAASASAMPSNGLGNECELLHAQISDLSGAIDDLGVKAAPLLWRSREKEQTGAGQPATSTGAEAVDRVVAAHQSIGRLTATLRDLTERLAV